MNFVWNMMLFTWDCDYNWVSYININSWPQSTGLRRVPVLTRPCCHLSSPLLITICCQNCESCKCPLILKLWFSLFWFDLTLENWYVCIIWSREANSEIKMEYSARSSKWCEIKMTSRHEAWVLRMVLNGGKWW